jgi:hypothetical protein
MGLRKHMIKLMFYMLSILSHMKRHTYQMREGNVFRSKRSDYNKQVLATEILASLVSKRADHAYYYVSQAICKKTRVSLLMRPLLPLKPRAIAQATFGWILQGAKSPCFTLEHWHLTLMANPWVVSNRTGRVIIVQRIHICRRAAAIKTAIKTARVGNSCFKRTYHRLGV